MISTTEIFLALRRLPGSHIMDMRKWWKYYSGKKRSIPTNQIFAAGPNSCLPLGGTRGSGENATRAGKRSTLTSQITTARHRSRLLPGTDTREW